MSQGRRLFGDDGFALLKFQLDDLVRDNEGMVEEVLGILERLMVALRRTRENRVRAQAMFVSGITRRA